MTAPKIGTLLALALASITFTQLRSVQAEDVYWDGVTGSWADSGNWVNFDGDPYGLPGSNDYAIFDSFSTSASILTTLGGPQTVGGLVFEDFESPFTLGISPVSADVLTITGINNQGILLDPTGNNNSRDVVLNFNLFAATTRVQSWTNLSDDHTITYNGTITLGNTLTFNGNGNHIVNGDILSNIGTSARSIEKNGSGTLIINGNIDTDTSTGSSVGNLRIMDGIVKVNTSTTSQLQLIFGTAAAGVQGSDNIGTLTLDNNSAVDFRLGGTLYVHRTSQGGIINSDGGGSSSPFISLNGTKTFMVGDSSSAVDLLVQVGIADGTTAASGLVKRSIGTMVMEGINTYTGATFVDRGKLILDYQANNGNNKLSDTAATNLRGGWLELRGNDSAATSETISALTIGSGSSTLAMVSTGQTTTLNIDGNLNRSALTGVINFTTNDQANTQIIVGGTTTNNPGGFLGGWATYNSNRWATKNASNQIVALDGTLQNNSSLWTSNDNIIVDGAITGPLVTPVISSLILNAASGSDLVINNHAAALIIDNEAILLGSDAAADATISGGQLMTSNITNDAINELIITNLSESRLTISSNIGSNTTYLTSTQHLNLAGPGLIELSGNSSANGNTYINGNVLVTSSNALNAYGAIVMSTGGDMTNVGARLDLSNLTTAVGRLSGGADTGDGFFDRGPGEIALGSTGNLTVHQTINSTYNGTLTGLGGSTITKKGNGILTLQTNTSTFSGRLEVLGGGVTLQSGSSTLNSLQSLLVRGGAVTSNQTSSDSSIDHIGNSAIVRLQGTTGNGLLVSSSRNTNTQTETMGALHLEGGANTLTVNNTAATPTGSVSNAMAFAASSNSLARSNGATLLVRGRNLGLTASATGIPATRITFTNTTALDAAMIGTGTTAGDTNLRILPYAIGENNTTSALTLAAVGNSFLTYGAGGTGLRALTDAEYTSTFTADNNVSLNTASAGLVGTTINSLRLVNTAGNTNISGTGNLVLTSGALLMTAGTTDNDSTISGFTNITSGPDVDEIIAFVTSANANAANAILTISSSVTDNGEAVSLTKSGAGTLVLNGTNSYTGTTTINQGVLQFSNAGNLGAGLIRLSGGTLRWDAGNTTDITAGSRPVELLGSSVYLTPNVGGNILNAGSSFDIGANNVTLANAIGNNGYGGLTKLGSGTLTLSAAPTYTGATWVADGTMNFATIAPDTTEALYLVRTTGGTVSSTITNGLNTQSIIVGGAYTNPGSNTTGVTGTLTVNGGAVNIGNGQGDDFILVGYRDASAGVATSATRGTADFRNASEVNIDVQSLHIGYLNGATPSPNNTTTSGIMFLSQSGPNLVKAGSIILGHSPIGVINSQNSNVINSEIVLGAGSNTVHTDTFIVGGAKSNGKVTISSGGDFTLRGWQGGDTGANLYIGDNDETNTNVANTSLFDLTGASDVDMNINLLIVGRMGQPNNIIARGDGTLTFDTGLIRATTILLADYNYHGDGSAGSGVPSLTRGTINQSGDATFRFMNLSKGTGVATWNWNSGTIQNLENANQTNENVVISLNGSGTATDPTLRNYIVDENQTSTFEEDASFTGTGSFTKSGEGDLLLEGTNTNTGNVLINEGSITLSGTGSMDDAAWINIGPSGSLDVTQRTGGTYTSDAVISGTGTIKATTFTVGSNTGTGNTNGVIRPGSSSNNNSASNAPTVGNLTGTLSVQGNLTLAASTERIDRAVLQIFSTTYNASSSLMTYGGDLELWADNIPTDHAAFLDGNAGANYDHIDISGQLNVSNNSGITIIGDSYIAVAGDVFNLLDWVGASLDNSFTIGERYRTGAETGLDLILPDISLSGLQWDTSLFQQHGIIVVTAVIPEPARAILIFLGLSTFLLHRKRR
ncbi:PEP-CTERM sorting domain-containing protein [Phragmitibacter flavus]|uniref:PEP-CTERM sorting domain-containing protein n=1 Tax=Phragmitibacter flavus TaxID=2576071 RepID=A0A5R8K9C4_9BACT|nr:autotransporter-associated beta strand repeat-containing protein [Phragmitibacter flavus]TLD68891.1 PEP-CTERM sorting domain-containing protein [Phragmitibacter flavus]